MRIYFLIYLSTRKSILHFPLVFPHHLPLLLLPQILLVLVLVVLDSQSVVLSLVHLFLLFLLCMSLAYLYSHSLTFEILYFHCHSSLVYLYSVVQIYFLSFLHTPDTVLHSCLSDFDCYMRSYICYPHISLLFDLYRSLSSVCPICNPFQSLLNPSYVLMNLLFSSFLTPCRRDIACHP